MKRRTFIKSGISITGGLFASAALSTFCSAENGSSLSRIVIAEDPMLHGNSLRPDTDRLSTLLDNAIQTWFQTDSPQEGWKSLVHQGQVVGLKVNCLSGYGSTHPELVDAVCERLQAAGIKAGDIIIWDRLNSDLEDGDFRVRYQNSTIRCFGNDAVGFENDFEIYGSAASLVSKTLTQMCDVVINLPVLRDHGIAGITCALKNMFGAIHNPNKYHLDVGDPYIADVYMLPSIRQKVRFTICDAIEAQYEGGPSYMPQWRWPYRGLILGRDPVALDYTAWQIIEQKRLQQGLKSLKEVNREPTYISTAANTQHRIGTNNPENIQVVTL